MPFPGFIRCPEIARQEEQRLHVDREDRVPGLLGDLRDGNQADDPGRVDEPVDLTGFGNAGAPLIGVARSQTTTSAPAAATSARPRLVHVDRDDLAPALAGAGARRPSRCRSRRR